MPCRAEREGIIPGLHLGLKQGVALKKVPGEKPHTDSACHGDATKTTTFVGFKGASPNLIIISRRHPCYAHRQDTENVHHYLRVDIRAFWCSLHLPQSLRLCSWTHHATDRQPIRILIIPYQEEIY